VTADNLTFVAQQMGLIERARQASEQLAQSSAIDEHEYEHGERAVSQHNQS
jgi:hypothetical protein